MMENVPVQDQHLQVGASTIHIFLAIEDGKIVLIKRSPKKKMAPNKYGGFSGHVEPDELIEDAAQRELSEEAEVDATPIEFAQGYLGKVDTHTFSTDLQKPITKHATVFFISRPGMKVEDIKPNPEWTRTEAVDLQMLQTLVDRLRNKDVGSLARGISGILDPEFDLTPATKEILLAPGPPDGSPSIYEGLVNRIKETSAAAARSKTRKLATY